MSVFEATAAAAAAFAAALAVRKLLRPKKPVAAAHLRGRALRTPEEADALLRDCASPGEPPLQVGRRLFPARVASEHLAVVGATGSGKTLIQRLLMQSALARIRPGSDHRALVYDPKQDMLSVLAGMRLPCPVRVLNPLDSRCVAWDMAADITGPASALQAARILAPEAKGDANPFFTNAAQHILYGLILALVAAAPGRWTFRQLLLILRDPERTGRTLEACPHTAHLLQYFAHQATFMNIHSTILSHTAPLEIVAACWDRAKEALSLRHWLTDESVLLLGNDEENRAAIDTVNRLLFRRLSELALAREEVDETLPRRTWFFLDEVREAGRLDTLSRVLTKGRSKGIACVLGFQDVSGMREAYGREVADEILGQCNTKVVLRQNSPETAEWASRLFGAREVVEARASSSRNHRFGARLEGSAGQSVSHAVAQRPLVLNSELLGLPETNRQRGLSAWFLSPITGPFQDRIPPEWLERNLQPPNRSVANCERRDDSELYLRPWDEEDERRSGLRPALKLCSS